MTILRMCEWTIGKTEVPLFNIDGKHNLADLLTKKHELSLESVTLNSNSISSLAAGLARVQVNLVVDPVLHGWTKTLRQRS